MDSTSISTSKPKTSRVMVGFVGLGRMGANMARRLHDRGHSIAAVYDVQDQIAKQIAFELGAKHCHQLEEITQTCNVIFTVVTDDDAMRRIFAPSGDSLLNNAKGRIFINCATISPKTHLEIEHHANAAGAETLEACMASSITQAREGTLYLMLGGNKETFKKVEPILQDLSGTMRYIGPTGQAAQVKALVNMVMNINTAGLAEGLALGDALGLDLTMVREVFSQTGANSQVLKTDGEDMQNREHTCYFSAAHAAKDSGIALTLARSQELTLPLAEATKKQYDRMVQLNLGELDKSGIAELTFKGRTKS